MTEAGIRLRHILFLSALLSACAYRPSDEYRHIPQPGWECRIGRAGQSEFTATAILDQHGQQLSADWRWHTRGKVLSFGLEGSVQGERSPSVRDGIFRIDWRRTATPGRPIQAFRLELTSDPERGGWSGGSAFSGVAAGGGVGLHANWLDTLALARGAEKLHIVVRDDKSQVLDRHAFPDDILARASAAATAGLERLEAMKSGYRTQCDFTEDLAPDFVIP